MIALRKKYLTAISTRNNPDPNQTSHKALGPTSGIATVLFTGPSVRMIDCVYERGVVLAMEERKEEGSLDDNRISMKILMLVDHTMPLLCNTPSDHGGVKPTHRRFTHE